VTAFKNQGITADDSWFAQNSNHPIARIRAFFDKKIVNTVGRGTNLSIRRQYIELQRAPYGLKCNALSAFVLGIALRHILDKGYQWDNQQKTGTLDTDVLAEIIEAVVKDDGQDKIKLEKHICRLSREEKAFVEKAPRMFRITNIVADARVEDVLLQIQNRVEELSARVPLWVLPEYINSVGEPFADIISEILNNICLAGSTSSKSGKSEERTNAIKDVGKIILDNPSLVDTVAGYIETDYFVRAFQIYVDRTAPPLAVLAQEIDDVTHRYCQSICDKAAETAGLLWKQSDISAEIDETIEEYEIIKLMKPFMGFVGFVSFKNTIDTLRDAVVSKNKLPKTLLTAAFPALSMFLTNITNIGTTSNIKDGLAQNINVIKELFFDVSKIKSIELLKQRLSGLTISDSDLFHIYNDLQSGFLTEESVFLDNVRTKIENFIKNSIAQNIKTEWKRITDTDSPTDWANVNNIPARFALNGIASVNDIIAAVESPDKFSSDKLGELLDALKDIPNIGIAVCQKRFMEEIIPKRFVKFNITLSSLIEFLKNKYGEQPNNWSPRPDLSDFIRNQYKGTFAPQVAEKIKRTSAEDLKNFILQLAQENPDLGLLFWE